MLLALLLLAGAVQDPYSWYARGPYRPAVPRPDSVLGYPIGSRHTSFLEQRRVLDRMIAAAPERVRTEVVGRSAEGRDMRLVIISAPANIERLEEIRSRLARLADPRATTPADAERIAASTPAVAFLSHSVHGNEPAGFEAAMVTAYQLLASDEPATLAVLERVVTIINPTMNPDGHERFAAWSNSVAVGSAEPASLEHDEPWSVQGRFNHYRFDMNRDLLAQSQLETKAVAGAVVRWHPQIFVDLHSTTSQYFFAPAALPINSNLPAASVAWLERVGRGNAAAFDRFGWQYYVRDVFDLFYPGYWDSWPSLHGATGMTYETDGGPELRLRKDDGTVTAFADGIAHHVVASLATLETLAAGRSERLVDYYRFRASGIAEARAGPFQRVVLVPGADSGRASRLVQLLARQDIEVTVASGPVASRAAHDYHAAAGTPATARTFPAGSYVIDLAQPQARLARALLEPRALIDSTFARRQIERFERNRRRGEDATREGYEFYDVTAWSLPLAFGLDAWWTEDAPAVAGIPVRPQAEPAAGRVASRARSAYVWCPGSTESARLAMRLLLEGFAVGASAEPLRAGGRDYPSGTFVVRVQRNPAAVHDRIAELARETGASVDAVESAFPDRGQVGVGSESIRPLHAPRVLLAAGDGVSQPAFGSVWFYLERELGIPVTPVTLAALGRIPLADYSVLVVPDGSAGRMAERLGAAAGAVASWVRLGGAVIGIGAAADLLARKELGLTTVSAVGPQAGDSVRSPAPDSARADTTGRMPPLVSPTAPAPNRPEFVPGAIARATLDRTHWLAYGYDRPHLPVLVNGDVFFTPSRKGDNPVAFAGGGLVLAGFTWPGNTERLLQGAAWAVVENVGSGRVILFAEDPLFRGFWRGTAGLFNNALLFGPGRSAGR